MLQAWKTMKLLSATSALVCFETFVGYLGNMPGGSNPAHRTKLLAPYRSKPE